MRSAERESHLWFVLRYKLKQSCVYDRAGLQFGGISFAIVPKRQGCNCKYGVQIKILTAPCTASFAVLCNCMCLWGSQSRICRLQQEAMCGEKHSQLLTKPARLTVIPSWCGATRPSADKFLISICHPLLLSIINSFLFTSHVCCTP